MHSGLQYIVANDNVHILPKSRRRCMLRISTKKRSCLLAQNKTSWLIKLINICATENNASCAKFVYNISPLVFCKLWRCSCIFVDAFVQGQKTKFQELHRPREPNHQSFPPTIFITQDPEPCEKRPKNIFKRKIVCKWA